MLIWKNRVVVAAALLAIVAGLALAESLLLWQAATLALAAGAAHEWGRLCRFNKGDNLLYAGVFALFALLSASASELFVHHTYFGAAALFWVAVAPWWTLRSWRIGRVLAAAAGLLIIYSVWIAAALLYAHDPRLLYAGLALVWVFDSASYAVGRLIGRTPLALTISPKKTVEGFLGGCSAAFIGAVIYSHYWAEERVSLAVTLSAVFSLVVLAALGDMFVSAQKRRAGVKDSGFVFGNHGGILDRIDSLLPVLPMAALLSHWV